MTWLLLAFPSGRLRTTPARTIVIGAFVMCVALQVPLILVDPLYSLNGALAVTDRPDLTDLLLWGQRIVAGGVLLATAVTLALRLTLAGGLDLDRLGDAALVEHGVHDEHVPPGQGPAHRGSRGVCR